MNVSEFFLRCSDLATSWALTSAVVLSKITVAVTPVLTRGGVFALGIRFSSLRLLAWDTGGRSLGADLCFLVYFRNQPPCWGFKKLLVFGTAAPEDAVSLDPETGNKCSFLCFYNTIS